MSDNLKGFSLMELLIALVIVGILSAIAIPTYMQYRKRAHYCEMLLALQPYKVSVTECYIITGKMNECNGGKHGVNANLSKGTGNIQSITTTKGTITITPNDKNGITSKDTYILTPTVTGGRIHWKSSGGAVAAGLAK